MKSKTITGTIVNSHYDGRNGDRSCTRVELSPDAERGVGEFSDHFRIDGISEPGVELIDRSFGMVFCARGIHSGLQRGLRVRFEYITSSQTNHVNSYYILNRHNQLVFRAENL